MTYSFQTFTLEQILTAAQMNQVEANTRDHIHGRESVLSVGISFPDTAKSSGFTAVAGNVGELFLCTGTFTVDFSAAATLGSGWAITIGNIGNGIITLDPNSTETIDGFTTTTLAPNESVVVYSNGSNLLTIGGAAVTLGTPQATTSGTSKTFSNIISGTKLIVISFQGVSLNNTVDLNIQIGDSGGIESGGYLSTSVAVGEDIGGAGTDAQSVSSTTEFIIKTQAAEVSILMSGQMILSLQNSSTNTWISSHSLKYGTGGSVIGGGDKSLSGELTQLKISGVTFDAGAINIMYMG